MIRNRKQEIALCRRGLGAKALAASLLLAASSLPALSHDRIAEIGDVNEAPAGSWLFENLSAAGATPPLGGAVLSMTGNVTIAGADGLTFRGNRSGVMDAPASMIPGIGAFIAPLFPQFQFGGGGAVAALGGDVKLSGKILSLEDNSVSVKGTAVSDEIANWALGPVTLTNVAGARSAAMALGGGAAAMGELELDGAEALNLSGNSAQAEGSVAIAAGGAGAARGGAAVLKGSAITVTGNGVLAKGDALT